MFREATATRQSLFGPMWTMKKLTNLKYLRTKGKGYSSDTLIKVIVYQELLDLSVRQ